MAVQILSQSYGPRKPLISCTADSLSDLAGLVCAEGSTATVGGTEYVLDRVNGWVEPGSGGGGGSDVLVVTVTASDNTWTCNKTAGEIYSAMASGGVVFSYLFGPSGAENYEPCVRAENAGEEGFTFHSFSAFSPDGLPGELYAATENDYPSATTSN